VGDFLDDMGKLWPPPLSWGRRSYGRRRRAVRMRRADLEGQDRGRNGLEDPVERTRIPRLESPSAVDLDNDDDTGKEEKEEEKEEKEAEAEEKKAEEEVGELEGARGEEEEGAVGTDVQKPMSGEPEVLSLSPCRRTRTRTNTTPYGTEASAAG